MVFFIKQGSFFHNISFCLTAIDSQKTIYLALGLVCMHLAER